MGSGTGLWNTKANVVTEPLTSTIRVPAVGWRKIGNAKLAGKQQPDELAQESVAAGNTELLSANAQGIGEGEGSDGGDVGLKR